ncbi:MAG: aspartate aminotransferase family protein [Candidatus Thorarchaeota archaeon]
MLEEYKKSTPKSERLFDRARRVFPGGISHNLRTFAMDRCGAYPPFMTRGEGSHVWDVDGNQYVDWWMTHYAQILGHNNADVRTAIAQHLENGLHLGAVNEHQVALGEMIQSAIPTLSMMRFCSTGSEATMYAVRMARLFTNKKIVAKAWGGWHGGNDSLGYHISHPFTDHPFFDGVTFDFNDRDSVDSMIKKHGTDLAAVVVEPVLGAGGGIPPEPGFLPYLREETERRDILLIYDEIVTGFRLRYGSAGKSIYGAEPDLLTLGKIAGGGMHLGVYGGREDIMKLAAPGASGGRWVGGGTFSSHPLAMVAGVATLKQLQGRGREYESLNGRGDDFRVQLNNLFAEENFHAIATGEGSMMFISVLKHPLKDGTHTGSTLGGAVDHTQLDSFQGLLMERGVFGYHGLGALSFAHSKEDLEKTYEVIADAVSVLKREV